MFKILVLLFSLSAFSCTQSELEIQQQVFNKLILKYSADKNEPLKSLRKIDFYPGKRVRFLYVSTKLATKNIIDNYEIDDECQIRFKQLKF